MDFDASDFDMDLAEYIDVPTPLSQSNRSNISDKNDVMANGSNSQSHRQSSTATDITSQLMETETEEPDHESTSDKSSSTSSPASSRYPLSLSRSRTTSYEWVSERRGSPLPTNNFTSTEHQLFRSMMSSNTVTPEFARQFNQRNQAMNPSAQSKSVAVLAQHQKLCVNKDARVKMLAAAGTGSAHNICERCGQPKTKLSHPSRQWKCDDGIPCRMKEVVYPFRGTEKERTQLIEKELQKGTFRQQHNVGKKRSHDTARMESLNHLQYPFSRLSSTWTEWQTGLEIGESRLHPAHSRNAFSLGLHDSLESGWMYQHPYPYSELSSSSLEWTSNLSAKETVEEDPLVPVQRGQNFYVLE